MLELIFLSPLLGVLAGALIARFAVRRRPFAARGWAIVVALAVGAFFLPLAAGVWIPDFIGTTRTLATATSSSGYSFRVTQVWNYCDFYTSSLYITAPNGSISNPYLDGDDSKSWSVPIAIDEQNRIATVTLSGGRAKTFQW